MVDRHSPITNYINVCHFVFLYIGLWRTSTNIALHSIFFANANLDRAFAWLLRDRLIYTNWKFWHNCAKALTLRRDYAIVESLVLYFPWNCWTINWESLWAINSVTSGFQANLIPTISASYSATLFELENTNRREYSKTSPSGGMRTILALLPCKLGAPLSGGYIII